jgi:hypothetical protein
VYARAAKRSQNLDPHRQICCSLAPHSTNLSDTNATGDFVTVSPFQRAHGLGNFSTWHTGCTMWVHDGGADIESEIATQRLDSGASVPLSLAKIRCFRGQSQP